jgi:hypothetical protein
MAANHLRHEHGRALDKFEAARDVLHGTKGEKLNKKKSNKKKIAKLKKAKAALNKAETVAEFMAATALFKRISTKNKRIQVGKDMLFAAAKICRDTQEALEVADPAIQADAGSAASGSAESGSKESDAGSSSSGSEESDDESAPGPAAGGSAAADVAHAQSLSLERHPYKRYDAGAAAASVLDVKSAQLSAPAGGTAAVDRTTSIFLSAPALESRAGQMHRVVLSATAPVVQPLIDFWQGLGRSGAQAPEAEPAKPEAKPPIQHVDLTLTSEDEDEKARVEEPISLIGKKARVEAPINLISSDDEDKKAPASDDDKLLKAPSKKRPRFRPAAGGMARAVTPEDKAAGDKAAVSDDDKPLVTKTKKPRVKARARLLMPLDEILAADEKPAGGKAAVSDDDKPLKHKKPRVKAKAQWPKALDDTDTE